MWIGNPVKCFLSAASSPLTLCSSCSETHFTLIILVPNPHQKGLNVNVELLFLVIIVGRASRRSCLPLSIVAIVGSASSPSKVAFTSSWISAAAFGGLPGHRGPLSTLSSSACPPPLLPHPAYFSSSVPASRQSLHLCCSCSLQDLLSSEISFSIIQADPERLLHQPQTPRR